MSTRSKGSRKLVVAGKTYSYKVGRDTTVIRDENHDVLTKLSTAALAGMTPDDYARAVWKRASCGVTPKDVADAIQALP